MVQDPSIPQTSLIQHEAGILKAVSYFAEALLQQRDWQTNLNEAMAHLGTATNVTRIALRELEVIDGRRYFTLRSEWAQDPDMLFMQNKAMASLTFEQFGMDHWISSILGGQEVYGQSTDFPAPLAAFLEQANVKSIAIMPVKTTSKVWGILSFDQRGTPHPWRESELEALKTAARILGSTIQHNLDHLALKNAQEALERRVRNRTEELSHTVAKLQDAISARYEVEFALRESEKQYRLLAETTTDMITRHAADGKYVYVSPACRRLLGYEPEELLDKKPDDFIYTDDKKAWHSLRDMPTSGGNTVTCRYIHKKGHYVWLETNCHTIQQTKENEYVCSSRDVTDRRKISAEKQTMGDISRLMLDSESLDELYSQVLHMLCARFEFAVGTIQLLDEKTDELTSVASQGMDLMHLPPQSIAADPHLCNFSGNAIEPVFVEDVTEDSQHVRDIFPAFPVQVYICLPMRIEKRIIGAIKLADTCRRRIPETLRQTLQSVANQLAIQIDRKAKEKRMRSQSVELIHVARMGTMGEMASGLAHELNQPLSGIINYTTAALNLLDRDPQLARQGLVDARAAAERAAEIIRRMRRMIIRREPKRSTVEINRIIHESIALLVYESRNRGITIETELDDRIPPTLLDSIQIQQVLINLLNNAMDAIEETRPELRRILIRTTHEAGHVAVSVIDSGKIDRNFPVSNIFEPHFTSKKGGMGLGLSISRTIIDSHGGHIDVDLQCPQGTRFWFKVPLR